MIAESNAFTRVIFTALCACLGLNADSDQASALICQAYTEPENAPSPPRVRDVIYFNVELDDVDELRAPECRDAASNNHTFIRHVEHTLGYRLTIVCYGPNAEAYANQIRSFIFLDGSGMPRKILRDEGIYVVPHPQQPVILHEQINSLWRLRVDLVLSLRVRDHVDRSNLPALTSPPRVYITSER